MPVFSEKFRVLAWLSVILLVGFMSTSLVGYLVSRNAIRHGIASQALPQTGDNIYSEIQKDLLRPVFVSSQMAHDTFLRDWMLNGEKDHTQVVRYLREVKEKYGTITSFLVSEKSKKYYFAGGILKTVKESDERDAWYFNARSMPKDYETNVDFDMANNNMITVFINHKVMDYKGNYIGITGVGLMLNKVAQTLQSYQNRFGRRIFFVDKQGQIILAAQPLPRGERTIQARAGIRDIAAEILNSGIQSTQLEYTRESTTVLVNSRFIPELGWHLVVEQDETEEMRPVRRVLWLNIAISLAVTLLVLAIALYTVNRHQSRLEVMATHDALTGLLNRQALDLVFPQLLRDADRNRKPLSAILFDVDFFKNVNDKYGHLTGDAVLRSIANLALEAVRSNDVTVRWGGEEFLLLLKDCPLDEATVIAEKLRQRIANHDFKLDSTLGSLTVSLSVGQYIVQESQDRFFVRIDEALYRAKEGGRNQIAVSNQLA